MVASAFHHALVDKASTKRNSCRRPSMVTFVEVKQEEIEQEEMESNPYYQPKPDSCLKCSDSTSKAAWRERHETKNQALSKDGLTKEQSRKRHVFNARERVRVKRIGQAFENLRRNLPAHMQMTKMRKIDILHAAIYHMQYLYYVLNHT